MTNPTPKQIIDARNKARLTQTQAAELVGRKLRTWQAWEGGTNKMDPVLWEAFQREVKDHA